MTQMNKRFGLRKLKKIAGAPNTRWFVSPHFVLRKPEQFRLSQAKGMPRLVVRTDERGRKYNTFIWGSMPREDVHVAGSSEEHIQKELSEIFAKTPAYFIRKIPQEALIIHPTRPREDIEYTGAIRVAKGIGKRPPSIEIFIAKPAPDKKIHRDLPFDSFEVVFSNGSFALRNPNQKSVVHNQILEHAIDLLQEAVRTKQLNLSRPESIISFLTWKDAPSRLELFDMIERREDPRRMGARRG